MEIIMKIDDSYRPILIVPAIPYNGGIKFLLENEQIIVDDEYSREIWSILEKSNGHNDISQIINEISINKDLFYKILVDLVSLNIVCDSRELYKHFHNIASSPDVYYRNLSRKEIQNFTNKKQKVVKKGEVNYFSEFKRSNISDIISKRRSCRSFSDKPLSKDCIGNICYNAYYIENHVVPSGGGLYPLKIYVLIEKDQISIKKGYYEYDRELNTLIRFENDIDIERLKYCFNDEDLPFGSSVQIVIAADLNRETFKYSNRGYRLTLIEVGHVAQNINLFCTEIGVGVCELGGVLDKPLAQELNLTTEEITPILCLAIGYPNDKGVEFSVLNYKDDLIDQYVGKNKIVSEIGSYYFDTKCSFFAAYAKHSWEENSFSGATSTSCDGAIAKAIVEAYERYCSSIINVDFKGCANEIKGLWLDPRMIKPLSNEQCKKTGLKQFNKLLPLNWCYGEKIINNEKILVPIDLVYYGFKEKNVISYGDSSGVAAYTNYDEAEKRAILELVERDAIMRNWYSQKPLKLIDYKILPTHLKRRVDYWAKNHYKMYFFDLNSPYAPSFLVIIVGETYPCFSCGSAATIDNCIDALNKATKEAEFSLLIYARKSPKELTKEEVFTPEDHGLFYTSPKNIKKLKWMWNNNKISNSYPPIVKYEDLINLLDPIVFDLSKNFKNLRVIRAISPKCIPIGFGLANNYYLHSEVKKIELNLNSLKNPHYFA